MAKLKGKTTRDKRPPVDLGDTLTTEETEAISASAPNEEDNSGVSSQRLEHALAKATEQFNLKDQRYGVYGFKDAKGQVTLNMSNDDFDLTVVFKDPDKFLI